MWRNVGGEEEGEGGADAEEVKDRIIGVVNLLRVLLGFVVRSNGCVR